MDYLKVNKDAWDKRTPVHIESEFYDVAAFKEGQCSLNKVELEQLGDVTNKSLLHLQCHFGLDTLSWARLGAKVTGVDISTEAIEQADNLKQQLSIDATFIAQDVYSFAQNNNQQFDIVFTSYGALCWLPDIDRWAETVASALAPNGELHVVEFHTFNDLLDGYAYFTDNQPDIEDEGTYTENCDGTASKTVTWTHPISEIINAIIKAGLAIESFNEYPFSPYNCFENMEYVEGQGYQLLHKGKQIPLVYSIKARKG